MFYQWNRRFSAIAVFFVISIWISAGDASLRAQSPWSMPQRLPPVYSVAAEDKESNAPPSTGQPVEEEKNKGAIAPSAGYSSGRARVSPSINNRVNTAIETDRGTIEEKAVDLELLLPSEDKARLKERFPAIPVWLSSTVVYGRGALAVDSTRLKPGTEDYFLPSAVPVRGEPFFETGGRADIQGSGNAISLSIDSVPLNSTNNGEGEEEGQIKAFVQIEVIGQSGDQLRVQTPNAYVAWNKFLVGQADSNFGDPAAVPETIDLGGPNARPWVQSGQAQIRYELCKDKGPLGFSGNIGIEMPRVDIYTPEGDTYSTFSRFPDFVGMLRIRGGDEVPKPCPSPEENLKKNNMDFDEWWHLQMGVLVRDLDVENAANTVREGVCGWGTYLSGHYSIFRDRYSCEELRDTVWFSVTYGEGIARYFNDLHLIDPVYDAVYNVSDDTLTSLPVTAFYGGYQHEWTTHWRSTAVYSRVQLDSEGISSVSSLPGFYRDGQYMAINLIHHREDCVILDKSIVLQTLYTGVEYLFGQKEDQNGDFGTCHRVMFVLAASH